MNIEIQKDTIHTFNFPDNVFGTEFWLKNSQVPITNATIEITTADGDDVLAEIAMTISGDTFSASYIWDSSDKDVGVNYLVKFKINGECYNRFFDIYYYPFKNAVTDEDLFSKDDSIQRARWAVSGKANNGTVATLVDTNRLERDDEFKGGKIELYYDDKIETRKITGFVQATNTITFAPVVAEAVSENLGYAARESFQSEIDEAGNEVQERFRQIQRRAYLLIDHSQMKTPIILKCLANIWRKRIKEVNDEYDLKYQHYIKGFEAYFARSIWKYDSDASGVIDPGEENETTYIKWTR